MYGQVAAGVAFVLSATGLFALFWLEHKNKLAGSPTQIAYILNLLLVATFVFGCLLTLLVLVPFGAD
jgi:hypothetical protein